MARSLKKIHIVDIESTCWRSGAGDQPASPSGNCRPNEIIEIGIARLNLTTMEIDQQGQYYCKPIWFPILSSFCTELTGITQDVVDEAPTFPEQVEQMQSDFGKNALKSNVWVSWGDYDRIMFEHMQKEVWGKKVPPCSSPAGWFKNLYPFGRRHINLKNIHALLSGVVKELSVQGALVTIGEKFEGNPHCGKDDAFNIAKILLHIIRENRRKILWWNL